MPVKHSAGLLMYRPTAGGPEVLLAHPGGPFFARKDLGAWTLPKGLIEGDEPALDTAVREFHEETGLTACAPFLSLGTVVQKGGKVVEAWAFRGDWPADHVLVCNTFDLEWPHGSGRIRQFPEVDRAELFSLSEARRRINPAQIPFLDRLADLLAGPQLPETPPRVPTSGGRT